MNEARTRRDKLIKENEETRNNLKNKRYENENIEIKNTELKYEMERLQSY